MSEEKGVRATTQMWVSQKSLGELGLSFSLSFQGSKSGCQAGSASAFPVSHLASPALSFAVVSEAILLSSAAVVLNLSPDDQTS